MTGNTFSLFSLYFNQTLKMVTTTKNKNKIKKKKKKKSKPIYHRHVLTHIGYRAINTHDITSLYMH